MPFSLNNVPLSKLRTKLPFENFPSQIVLHFLSISILSRQWVASILLEWDDTTMFNSYTTCPNMYYPVDPFSHHSFKSSCFLTFLYREPLCFNKTKNAQCIKRKKGSMLYKYFLYYYETERWTSLSCLRESQILLKCLISDTVFNSSIFMEILLRCLLCFAAVTLDKTEIF